MPDNTLTPPEEESGLYALEDIMEEFSSDPSDEVIDTPEPEEAETPSEPPETSDFEMADVIAQAVAASFDGDAPEFFPEPAEEDQVPEMTEPDSEPEPAPTEQAEPSEPEPPEPEDAEPPAPEDRDNAPDKPKKPQQQASKKRRPAAKKKKPVKVPDDRGPLHSGFMESFTLMLQDLRTRRREDLPDNQSSLKEAERRISKTVRLCSPLAMPRYIILALMLLSLMGRRYSWMLFGVLGGETGMIAAVLLTIAAMGVSWHAVLRGWKDMVYMRFSLESLLLVLTILSLLETVLLQNTATLLPFQAIGWSLAGTADLMLLRSRLRGIRTLLSGKTRTGVRVTRLKDGNTYIGKAPAGTAGFVRRQEEIDSVHSGWSLYAIPLLLVALIISAYLTAKTEGNYLSILVTLLTVSLPVSALLCCARPFELLTRVMNRTGAVSGWFGMKRLSGQKRMLIYDTDLFPKGTITHKGVKIYGNQTPRLLVSYGASLAFLADNGLTEPFSVLMQEVGGQRHHVNYFQVTEGGLTGQIHGVRVALGTYNFMHLIGIIPPKRASKSGLFIALNEEIAGVFAIQYKAKAGSIPGFQRLVRESGLKPVAATKNLSVNPYYMRSWFQIPMGGILCPKVETRWSLSRASVVARGTVCGYVFHDGIASYSRLVAGARKSYRAGMLLTLISIVCSLVLLIITAAAISAGKAPMAETRLLLIQLVLFLLGEGLARNAVR